MFTTEINHTAHTIKAKTGKSWSECVRVAIRISKMRSKMDKILTMFRGVKFTASELVKMTGEDHEAVMIRLNRHVKQGSLQRSVEGYCARPKTASSKNQVPAYWDKIKSQPYASFWA